MDIGLGWVLILPLSFLSCMALSSLTGITQQTIQYFCFGVNGIWIAVLIQMTEHVSLLGARIGNAVIISCVYIFELYFANFFSLFAACRLKRRSPGYTRPRAFPRHVEIPIFVRISYLMKLAAHVTFFSFFQRTFFSSPCSNPELFVTDIRRYQS